MSHASWKRRFVVTGTDVSAWLLMFTESPAGSRIDDGALRGDGDRFRNGADRQGEINLGYRVQADRRFANHGLKAGQLGADVVRGGRQIGDAVDTVAVGRRP